MKKTENECGIVEDLLPLYTEGMAGEESVRFIEAHLEECESCRAEAEGMRRPKPTTEQDIHGGVVPLLKMHKIINRRRNRSVLFTALVLIAVFSVVFSNLTSPRYFDYSDGVVSVSVTDDGHVYLWFSDEVTDWTIDKVKNDEGRDFYTVTAYYSLYDRLLGRSKEFNMHPSLYPLDAVIKSDDGEIPVVFYVQNNGEDDVCLSGDISEIGMVRTLPRLVLGYYLLIAAGCLILLLIVYALLRRKESVAAAIKKMISLPTAYIVAHLAIKGFVTVSYSAIHDFIYIVFTAAVIWSAVIVMQKIIKEKSE